MTEADWMTGESSLRGPPPHRRGGSTHRDINIGWFLASAWVGVCGIALYGPAAIRILLICMASATAARLGLAMALRQPVSGRFVRAGLIGLLFGLTLPATVPWQIALLGSVIAILLGQGVFGGVLHPALVGRVVVQFVFGPYLSLATGGALALSPVLTPADLFVGDLFNAERVEHYQGWLSTQEATTKDAYLLERPVQELRRFAQTGVDSDGGLPYVSLLRDALPPWYETVIGAVPGGIGETCAVALIIAGLFLIYRGYLRWQLPVVLLGSAALAAAILPVDLGGNYQWFPALEVEQGSAVGLAYVLYHLTSGQLMLGAFLLAGDSLSSPMRVHGQIVFAAGVGVLTIFMRLYGVLEGECYWSILMMNVLVGTINHRMKRPVLGMKLEPER
ncbi:MAG: RnfABCDGE type electron transport complex subunit D [Phycisphaerae bacterium]